MVDYNSLHLDKGESVIMEVRKHWIVFFAHAFSLIMAAVLPFIIFTALKVFLPQVLSIFYLPVNMPALFLFFYVLWLLFIWASFFLQWTKYYLDVWYVTEKRIIDISQKSIFDREITNLRFDRIQDVTIDISGFIPTLLNFGNIKVQTAGEDNKDFTMNTVRHPDRVRKILFGQHNDSPVHTNPGSFSVKQ